MVIFFLSYHILSFFFIFLPFTLLLFVCHIGRAYDLYLTNKQKGKSFCFNGTCACQHKYRPETENIYVVFKNQSRTANILIDEEAPKSRWPGTKGAGLYLTQHTVTHWHDYVCNHLGYVLTAFPRFYSFLTQAKLLLISLPRYFLWLICKYSIFLLSCMAHTEHHLTHLASGDGNFIFRDRQSCYRLNMKKD